MEQDWAGLGQQLRARRIERGLSQEAVGAFVGVDKSMVSRWEHGEPVSNPLYVFGLEVELGFEPGELSRLVGYLPVGASKRVTPEVALREDPDLDAAAIHDILVLVRRYRDIVRRERGGG